MYVVNTTKYKILMDIFKTYEDNINVRHYGTVSGNKKVMDKWTDIISESSLFKGVEKMKQRL